MAKREYKKQPKPPHTKFSFEEYKEKALDLYHNEGLKKNKIMAKLGTPYWEGKEWFVEFSKKDPNKFTRVQAAKKVKLLETREIREDFVDKDVLEWAERLDKEGKWPKGKSLQGFIATEKRLQTLYDKEIARLKSLGLDVSDGHIIALANENVRGTPLDAKGKGGSHSPRSRVPEKLADNKSRGANYDIDKLTARKAGIPTTSAEAFAQYLTGDQGTGVRLTTKDKQRIHIQGENPDVVIADRYNYVEGKKAEVSKKKNLLETDKALSLNKYAQSKFNGNGNGNGVNGNGRNGKGLNTKVGGLRRTDSGINLALQLAQGNYGGAAVSATALTAGELLKTKAGQKQIATQFAKLAAKRGGKTALKLIPGLDILISGKEAWDYARQGKFDQAGIAALSGAIGWIPVVGDAASATLDLTNTGIDISRGALNVNDDPKTKKKSVRRTKL